jgi:acetyltransferase-like isoleucine patch superfamily enzyme
MLHNTEFAVLGANVLIRDGARIELLLKKGRPYPRLVIGDHTNIEQNVHIACVSEIIIGRGVSITANCAIVDVTHPYNFGQVGTKIGERIDETPRPVEIGDGSFIGMGTIVLPGSQIGRGSVIGAGSIVTGLIPEYSVAVGRPAVVTRRFDVSAGCWKLLRESDVC